MLFRLFCSKADTGNCFPDEDAVNDADPATVEAHVRGRLRTHGFSLAEESLNFLVSFKTRDRGPRDDGSRSEYHEFRQALAALSFIENGMIPRAAQRRFGSPEILVCIAFVHDLGEDFGVTSTRLHDYLTRDAATAKAQRTRGALDIRRDTIERVCNAFDVITYKRDGQPIDGKGDPNVYQNCLLKDPYALLAKYIDRNDNLATMVGGFTHTKQCGYLDKTLALFSLRDMVGEARKKYPDMKKAFEAADNMMLALDRLGRFNCLYHPDANAGQKPGKRLDIRTASTLSFGGSIRKGETAYCGVPGGFHPLRIQESRIFSQPHMQGSTVVPVLRRELQVASRCACANTLLRVLTL